MLSLLLFRREPRSLAAGRKRAGAARLDGSLLTGIPSTQADTGVAEVIMYMCISTYSCIHLFPTVRLELREEHPRCGTQTFF